MKKTFLLSLLTFITVTFSFAQNVAINATGALPDNSAMLDVSSTTKGFLPPRMTQSQRNSISLPATGIIIYQTDATTGLFCNKGTPAAPNWQLIGPAPLLSYGYFSGNQSQEATSSFQDLDLNTANVTEDITLSFPGRAIIAKTGLYRIAYQLNVEISPGGITWVNITVNGVNTSPVDSRQTGSNGSSVIASMSDERIMMLNAGDAVSIRIRGTVSFGANNVRCNNRSLFITQLR